MAAASGVEFRDYIRVFFARAWWVLFITLAVVGSVFFYSFYHAPRVYLAENAVIVTDKFSGSLSKEMGGGADWVARTRRAELDLKRSDPARGVIKDAAAAIGMPVSEERLTRLVESFSDDMRLVPLKDGNYIKLSYQATDGKFAAAVLSLFVKRMLESCVTMQVGELNNEVATLTALRSRLASDVAAAERRLDAMKTVAPELRLTASTMAVLKSGQNLTTLPSTDQAVAVSVELQKNIIILDGEIADTAEQIAAVRRQIIEEPQSLPSQRKLEAIPAVRDAMKKRDELRIQLAQLLSNSTSEHPMVRKMQADLKSLDAFLSTAATTSTVEVVYEQNARRDELQKKLAALESDLAGKRQRRANMEENAAKWKEKLDAMPAELRIVREASDEYEKKAQNLSMITDRLVQAQIKRNIELEQVGTYYRAERDVTPVPKTYRNKHLLHILLGIVLGLVTSVFAVYAIEFADHSVKDHRDLRLHTKATLLGVIPDYNQLKAVASRAAWARAAGFKTYLLAAIFVGGVAALGWATWRSWPKEGPLVTLPASLSSESVVNIEEAMKMYGPPAADLDAYVGAAQPDLGVTPVVQIPAEAAPQPALSE